MILRKIWKRIKEQYTSLPNVEMTICRYTMVCHHLH